MKSTCFETGTPREQLKGGGVTAKCTSSARLWQAGCWLANLLLLFWLLCSDSPSGMTQMTFTSFLLTSNLARPDISSFASQLPGPSPLPPLPLQRASLRRFCSSRYWGIEGIQAHLAQDEVNAEGNDGGKEDKVLLFRDIVISLRKYEKQTIYGSIHGLSNKIKIAMVRIPSGSRCQRLDKRSTPGTGQLHKALTLKRGAEQAREVTSHCFSKSSSSCLTVIVTGHFSVVADEP